MTTDSTRERILAAASDEFSAKGFEKTTVRDICNRADVNVAAINYHFRDKQNLYYKVLSHWMEDYIQETGLSEMAEAESTPTEKLRRYFRAELSYTCRENDPDGVKLNRARLILQELSAENHAPEIFDCHKEVEEKALYPVVKELIGDIDDPQIMVDALMATASMSTHYILRALDNPDMVLQTRSDLEKTTDFILEFALGGLKAIKEKYHDK